MDAGEFIATIRGTQYYEVGGKTIVENVDLSSTDCSKLSQINKPITFKGKVILPKASNGLVLSSMTFHGDVVAPLEMEAGSSIEFRHCKFLGDVQFSQMHVQELLIHQSALRQGVTLGNYIRGLTIRHSEIKYTIWCEDNIDVAIVCHLAGHGVSLDIQGRDMILSRMLTPVLAVA